jgi:diguanylate cyclase (GGDEF)-like protein/PAS domain S-box-containing protein
LLDSTPALLFAFDVETGEVVACNRTFAEALGRRRRDLVGRPLSDLHPDDDHPRLSAALARLRREGDLGAIELPVLRADGTECTVMLKAAAQRADSGGWHAARAVWTYVKRLQDEESLREDNERLQRLVDTDPLTDVLNRRGLERMLRVETSRAKRAKSDLCAVLIDCDDFKAINEAAGLAGGDAVLVEIATRLGRMLRGTDHLGRIGGDEFLVLLPGAGLDEATLVADKLRLCIASSPLVWQGEKLALTASLGVIEVTSKVQALEQILTTGHFALVRSKTRGKNRVTGPFQLPAENTTERLLQSVVAGSSPIRVVGHPIHRLEDGAIVGYELLSRFPADVEVGPDALFRLAIESQVLTPMDLRCLREAVSFASCLGDPLRIHVNLFPSTLLNTPSDRLIELFPLDLRSRFCVEISEQQLLGDSTNLIRPLEALRAEGISLAVDDVGFGHTVLESLVELDPEWIKIDRSRISGVGENPEMRPTLERLVSMLRPLGAELVAEGVESLADLKVVRELGISHAQGFLWGEPS